MEGHVSFFSQFLAIMNKAAVNTQVQLFARAYAFIFPGQLPKGSVVEL